MLCVSKSERMDLIKFPGKGGEFYGAVANPKTSYQANSLQTSALWV